jgi:predicted transcriptional regulator
MVVNNIIQQLISIGLSEYEAKAYTALIPANPVTAYEVGRLASIPTSKIYEVLARLEDKGMVMVLDQDGKKRYVPLSPEEFVEQNRTRFETTLNSLKSGLMGLRGQEDVSYIWNVRDYGHLLAKAGRMIDESENTIMLSGWPAEVEALRANLEKKSGLKIAVVNFGPLVGCPGTVFRHPIEDTLYAEKGGRGFTLVTDGREALAATINDSGGAQGAWSMNQGFVTVAEDYIKHDIYIMKIVNRFDSELIKRFGPNYEKLRDIFRDQEEAE